MKKELDPRKLQQIEAFLTEWYITQEKLTELKLREQELRRQIFDLAFPNAQKGSNKVTISHNMALIGRPKLNYSIDKDALDEAVKTGQLSPDLIDQVIRLDPKINEAAYNKLSTDQLKMMSSIVTERPGLPSIEVKSADKVRWS